MLAKISVEFRRTRKFSHCRFGIHEKRCCCACVNGCGAGWRGVFFILITPDILYKIAWFRYILAAPVSNTVGHCLVLIFKFTATSEHERGRDSSVSFVQ